MSGRSALIDAKPADENDYATEFLSLKMSVAVVDDLQAAIDHISRFGSGHSEAIITNDSNAAESFTRNVDAAAVLVERVHTLRRRERARTRG